MKIQIYKNKKKCSKKTGSAFVKHQWQKERRIKQKQFKYLISIFARETN